MNAPAKQLVPLPENYFCLEGLPKRWRGSHPDGYYGLSMPAECDRSVRAGSPRGG